MTAAWRAPGPVAAAFKRSPATRRLIMGPIGSGKTSLLCVTLADLVRTQRPSTVDGVRRVQAVVIRDTYRNLHRTTIRTWHQWMPRSNGEWTGGEGEPARHRIPFKFNAGGALAAELDVIFLAIGENKIEDVFGGLEPTVVWLNEAHLLSEDVFTFAVGRAIPPRYPPVREGGATWGGVLLDCNAPDDDHWLYKRFVEEPAAEHAFFRQPSGLSAEAENTANLPAGFYEQKILGQPDWWVRRMIRNEFGYSREGQPVYPEFVDALHVAPGPLRPVRGRPLIVAVDAGLTPAALIGQPQASGALHVLAEIVTGKGATMGVERLGDEINRTLAQPDYAGLEVAGVADPSSDTGADTEGGERTWMAALEHRTKIRFRRAPTNELTARLEAVRRKLLHGVGDRRGLLIDPRCKVLRKGFNSGYHLKRIRLAAGDRFEDKPAKNEFSHVHDAGQYLCLADDGHAEMTGRLQRRKEARMRRATEGPNDGYNPADYTFG